MNHFANLVMVAPDKNNNRFYRMTQNGNVFVIEMGRVGAAPVCSKRPMSLWQTTYNRKIAEGYEDRSDCCEVTFEKQSEYAEISDAGVKNLIEDLMHYAKKTLKESYTVSWKEVTWTMINKAQAILHTMPVDDVCAFNQSLRSLFTIIPRTMKNVKEMMADSLADIPEILIREQNLLDVLSAKISQDKKMTGSSQDKTILEALGLSIRTCSEKEEEQLRRFLNPESSPLFARAFRVHNHMTDERFSKYMREHGLTEKNIHYLYHGSKNANYFGILSEGLLLNPNAPITGKMFGYGIYFAPRARKAIGYTNIKGAHWTHGNSRKAYLMVYKVAYKNQKDVHVWSPEMTGYNKKKAAPYDAVFAHAGVSLLNDEIIIYDEGQATLQYLIELNV